MHLKKSLFLVAAVLIVDQISKIYVKTHFHLEESVEVFSWFKIYFIENEGAAWGTKLSDIFPVSERKAKLFLTLFRLLAIAGIGYWLWDLLKKQANRTLVLAVSLIFAGAVGNIIDSVFYGVLFDHSYGQVATFLAEDNYDSLFYGKVVDGVWTPGQTINAVAYDSPIPGYKTKNCISLRLWDAEVAPKDFDLASFNAGDYASSMAETNLAQQLCAVLYRS